MMSNLKAILIAVISTVLGGTIVAVLTSYLNAPEKASVSVQYQFVKVPNPPNRTYELFRTTVLKDTLSDVATDVVDALRRSVDLTIVTVTVKNNSDLKSRKIELSIPSARMWFFRGNRNNPSRTSSSSQFIIDSIGPGESVNLVAIGTDAYRAPVLQALHDDKKIAAFSTVLDADDPTGIAPAIAISAPMFSLLLMFVGAIVGILIIVIGGISALISTGIAWQAKFTTAKQLKNYQQVLDYSREHYPDRIKEAGL